MLVLPAHKKIDFGKVKTMLNSKSVSFATAEEVQKVTQCIPGGVPPFGNLFGIPVYMDRELLENTVINFNAGLQTVSIEMKVQDWLKIVNPIKTTFTKEY